jgi:hypothetical protein
MRTLWLPGRVPEIIVELSVVANFGNLLILDQDYLRACSRCVLDQFLAKDDRMLANLGVQNVPGHVPEPKPRRCSCLLCFCVE